MAATLTQVSARQILPAAESEAQAAAREAEGLRRQLLSRQHLRAAADWLERRQQLGLHVSARGRAEAGVGSVASEGGDLAELMRACLAALALPDQMEEAYRLPLRTLWPVPGSIARIRDRLVVLPDGSALTFSLPDLQATDDFRKGSAIAGLFDAGLELARANLLMLDQAEAWQIILV